MPLMTDVTGSAASKSEAKRIIEQGGVTYNGEKITDPFDVVNVWPEGQVLKVGKRKFARIIRA